MTSQTPSTFQLFASMRKRMGDLNYVYSVAARPPVRPPHLRARIRIQSKGLRLLVWMKKKEAKHWRNKSEEGGFSLLLLAMSLD